MRIRCHVCRRFTLKDTCTKCRRMIDAHYEKQLRLMRGILDAGIVEPTYYVQMVVPSHTKPWRN